MSIFWDDIDHMQFEALAFEFVRDRYPDHKWQAMPLTRDGNKDAEHVATLELLGEPLSIKAWMEAKYTRRREAVIPKAHLDSTLVSALIDPSVQAVVFVTNGRFEGNYVVRAQRALRLGRHARDPSFFDGRAVERWLAGAPAVAGRFFKSRPDANREEGQRIEVDTCSILRVVDFREGHFEPLRKLTAGQNYVLQLVISASQAGRAQLTLEAEGLRLADNGAIELAAGLCTVEAPVIAISPTAAQTAKVMVRLGEYVAALSFSYRVDAPTVEIQSGAQLRALQALFRIAQEQRSSSSSAAVAVWGGAGVGKSWTLERFVRDLPSDYAARRIQFAANPSDNARRLCSALLFLTFGSAAEFSVPALRLRSSHLDVRLMEDLWAGSLDAPIALQTVQAIARGDYSSSLMSPFAKRSAAVLVLDDLHKLSDELATAAARILREFATSENNTFVLIGARETLQEDLATAVDELAQVNMTLSGPSLDDVEAALTRIADPFVAQNLAPTLHTENRDGMLGLHRALAALSVAADTDGLTPANLDRALQTVRASDARAALAARRSAISRLTLQLVLLVDGGVEAAFLETEGLSQVAEDLIEEGLFVREATSPPRIAPKHDLLREIFEADAPSAPKKVGALLERYASLHPERRADLLGLLCQIRNPSRAQYAGEALALLRDLSGQTAFGQAKPLARELAVLAIEDADFGKTLSDADHLEIMFAHAECVNHVDSVFLARPLYELVAARAKRFTPTTKTLGFELLAEAEVLNCRFWQLDHVGLPQTARALAKRVAAFPEELRRLAPIATARNNALNRMMMTLAAQDDDVAANATFAEAEALALGDDAASGHIIMDKAKCVLKLGPAQAQGLYESAKPHFEKAGARRRLIVCSNQIIYCEVMRGDAAPEALILNTERLLEERYHAEHATALLELAAAYLVVGELERAERLLRSVQARPSSAGKHRRNMLLNHLLAVCARLKGELEAASVFERNASGIASGLGVSFQETLKHNTRVRNPTTARWSYLADADALWIDPRIW
jgi:GTPase SAR1 family protein